MRTLFEYNGIEVCWKGYASVCLSDEGFDVVVDPFGDFVSGVDANLVLVTHGSVGHFDNSAIDECCDAGSCLVLPDYLEGENVGCEDVEFIGGGELVDIFGVELEAVSIFNEEYESSGVGYRFELGSTSFYVAGATGLSTELNDLEGRVDVCFLPVDSGSAMSVGEAVKAAVRIKPDVVVPYHYGKPFSDSESINLRGLKAELEDRNIECRILEPEN